MANSGLRFARGVKMRQDTSEFWIIAQISERGVAPWDKDTGEAL